ncbi:MAG: hypothetical protein IPO88_23630 [Nannocystis sp.]|uniref:hypothetical protein n=1 Tax=Nannocystis sp. TaxID=1962667 RepID=UPI0024287399|nr:hypothetical protein [Nannocystis sp.]MBK9756434.1 hypothetical protein [Nannocystis sp.]
MHRGPRCHTTTRSVEPLALRLDRVGHSLAIDAHADTRDLMVLPIDLSGASLSLEVELTVERAEWAAELP